MNRAFIKSISFFALLAFAGFFTACQEEDSIMTTENFVLQSTKGIEDQCGAGRAGCYELVFPITLQFADSTTAVVNNYDEMKLAIRTWFEANGSGNGNGGHHGGGHHGNGGPSGLGRPIIVLPFQVITETGEIVTIETIEQLREIRALCNPGGPGGQGGPGGEPCFTLNFPLTISFPDGTQVVVNTKEEIKAAARAWNMNNPGLHTRPVFVFPITVTLRDGTILVVNSSEELVALKAECRG